MRYTSIVDKSEETLIMIIGKAEKFDQDGRGYLQDPG